MNRWIGIVCMGIVMYIHIVGSIRIHKMPKYFPATKTVPGGKRATKTEKSSLKPAEIVPHFDDLPHVTYLDHISKKGDSSDIDESSSGEIKSMLHAFHPELQSILNADETFQELLEQYKREDEIVGKTSSQLSRLHRGLVEYNKRISSFKEQIKSSNKERHAILDSMKEHVSSAIHHLIEKNVADASKMLGVDTSSSKISVESKGSQGDIGEIKSRLKSYVDELTNVSQFWEKMEDSGDDVEIEQEECYQACEDEEDVDDDIEYSGDGELKSDILDVLAKISSIMG